MAHRFRIIDKDNRVSVRDFAFSQLSHVFEGVSREDELACEYDAKEVVNARGESIHFVGYA